MARAVSILALMLLLLPAGCGSDDEGGGGGGSAPASGESAEGRPGGAEGAKAFISCFDAKGYRAVKPKPREESVFAFQARQKGYEVSPVNVQEKGMVTAAAFLVLFESDDKAKEAMAELKATSFGEVKPVQKGAAVIGYVDEEERKAFGSAVDSCLS